MGRWLGDIWANWNLQLETGRNVLKLNLDQTACGHPTLKDGVCFGPHALTPGFMESRNHRVFVAQIRTTESLLSVSPEIPQYSAWLYPQSHFPQIERTCHLTIGFHPNSVSSIQDEAWTTYSSCLLSNIERLLIGKCLGGIPRTSEHDPQQFL